MISMHKFDRIRKLKAEGKNASQIARELKLNRKTVSKYLSSNSPPKYSARKSPTKEDLFAPFEDQVKRLLKDCSDLTGADIFDLLVPLGYKGSQRTVFRRLQLLRPREKERFFNQVYSPGQQCQFDFKESVSLPFKSGQVMVNLHFGTLPYSGAFFISASRFKGWEAFGEGMHRFFEYIQGVPEIVRIDNLSACVKKVLKGSERHYTDSFNTAVEHYGFIPSACRPGKGNDKGDVEREIRTQTPRILKKIKLEAKVFEDLEDLNQWLGEFCKHRLTESVQIKLAEERQFLSPLPLANKAVTGRFFECIPTAWGTVKDSKNKSSYSVPNGFIGKKCEVLVESETVTISCKTHPEGPAVHQRVYPGEDSILPVHVIGSLTRKPGALLGWGHKEILFPNPSFSKFLKWLGGEEDPHAVRTFLKCVNLVQQVSMSEIGTGMDLIRESNSNSPFDDLTSLILSGHRPKQIPIQTKTVRNLNDYDFFLARKEA